MVSFSTIASADVVLLAVVQTGVTVKVTSLVVAGQFPTVAIVYLIVTSVLLLMSAGV